MLTTGPFTAASRYNVRSLQSWKSIPTRTTFQMSQCFRHETPDSTSSSAPIPVPSGFISFSSSSWDWFVVEGRDQERGGLLQENLLRSSRMCPGMRCNKVHSDVQHRSTQCFVLINPFYTHDRVEFQCLRHGLCSQIFNLRKFSQTDF